MTLRVLALVIIAALLAGCSLDLPLGGPAEPRVAVGGVARLPLWWEPSGDFNPLWAQQPADLRVGSILFEGLFQPGEDLVPEPLLAESYRVSSDSLQVAIQLRQDVTWHDGTPLSPRDVVFTWEQILAPDYDGPAALAPEMVDALRGAREYQSGAADHISGLEVVSDSATLLIQLERPDGALVSRFLFQQILPAHVYRELPANEDRVDLWRRLSLGTGPFALTSADSRALLLLSRHQGYYRGQPYLEGLELAVVSPPASLELLAGGGLDLSPLSVTELDDAQRLGGVTVVQYPQLAYQYLGMNLRDPILGDERVRGGIAAAIDRHDLVEGVMGGAATAIDGPLLPVYWASAGAPAVGDGTRDLALARQLLEQAGWSRDEAGLLRDQAGTPLTLTLKYPSADQVRGRVAAAVADWLRELGVGIDLQAVPFDALLVDVFERGDCQLYLLGWDLALDPDPIPIWCADSRWNPGGFTTPRLQELMLAGRASLEFQSRREAYIDWHHAVQERHPFAFLYMPHALLAVGPRLQGLSAGPGGYLNDMHLWWIPTRHQRGGR